MVPVELGDHCNVQLQAHDPEDNIRNRNVCTCYSLGHLNPFNCEPEMIRFCGRRGMISVISNFDYATHSLKLLTPNFPSIRATWGM